MKKIIIVLALGMLSHFCLAGGLKAYMSYAAFNTPDNQPYLETYLTIKGSSVKHVLNSENKYQGSVEVQIIFRKNDSIVNFAKYELKGPLVDDTLMGFPNLLDVQRYALGNGTFDIELKMKDKNSNMEPLVSYDSYKMDYSGSANSFSDIELLSSFEKTDAINAFTRNGYFLMPYVFNYFPENSNSLSFYTELYNNKIDRDNENFLLTYYLRPFEINKKLDKYTFINRKKARKVNSIMGKIDISSLPSGNYYLIVEARNRNNEIISSKQLFFQRFKPQSGFKLEDIYNLDPSNTFVSDIRNPDTLRKYIHWLKPISTDVEKAYATSLMGKDASLDNMQKYFLNFWTNRDNLYPLEAWKSYKANVIKVNYNFSTQNTPGFDTDRGRVFLQYGAPNTKSESYNEPNAYPYEIWHYYQLPDNQKNIKFVFYTQEIATNDFQLIHSNAVGELNNYKWRIWINNRDTRYTNLMNVDDSRYREIWGSNQDDYYNQPR
jgi:GWxTD domain-containing protein